MGVTLKREQTAAQKWESCCRNMPQVCMGKKQGRNFKGRLLMDVDYTKKGQLLFWGPTTSCNTIIFIMLISLFCQVPYALMPRIVPRALQDDLVCAQSSHSMYRVHSVYCRNYLTSLNISLYICKMSLKSQSWFKLVEMNFKFRSSRLLRANLFAIFQDLNW